MNESLERALNEVSLLKKTLNSEKTSHQNTLQQLQTTYQIIEQMKQILKNQQDKNKALTRQVKQKNNKIDQISQQYEEQIMSIKQLIERKDLQIKKYTQIKVTDYDMIRFRVISEVQAQHNQEIEQLKKQIQKCEYLYNESLFEIKVLREKNASYEKEIQLIKNQKKVIQQQALNNHTKQLTKLYALLEHEKLSRKQLQKRLERQSQKYKATIQKYHKQLQALQTQLYSLQQNNNQHPSSSPGIIQLKQSQFAFENEKLKRQIKQKDDEIYELNKKYKITEKQFKKKIDELQKDLNQAQFKANQLREDIKHSKILIQQQLTHKLKLQFEKRNSQLKQSHLFDLQTKQKEIKQLRKQLNFAKSQPKNQSSNLQPILDQEKQANFRLQRENQQLKAQLKKSTVEIVQLKSKSKQEQQQTRQIRAQSVQDVKQKLQVANAQIMNLLKDKIALNEKISKMQQAS